MTKECVNCPGATDHTTAECPLRVPQMVSVLRDAAVDAKSSATARSYVFLADTIEQQAREIERLNREAKNDAIAYRAAIERQKEIRAELAALRAQQPAFERPSLLKQCDVRYSADSGPAMSAQQPGVVLPDALSRAFITSESGDGSYRVVIKSATLQETQQVHNWIARLNSSPVSAGVVDERSAFDDWFSREVWKDGCYGNPDILKRQLWPCWQARAQLAAPAGVPDGWKSAAVYAHQLADMVLKGDAPHTAQRTAAALIALLAAAPSPAPTADVVPVPPETDAGGRNPRYEGCYEGETEEQSAMRRAAYCLSESGRHYAANSEMHAISEKLRALLNGGRDE